MRKPDVLEYNTMQQDSAVLFARKVRHVHLR